LAADGSRQKRFSRSWRPDQQYALRNSPAESLVFLGMLEKIDNLDELRLGLINSGDILEGLVNFRRLIVNLRAAFSECHRTSRTGPHSSRAVTVDKGEKENRDHPGEHTHPPGGLLDVSREC